MGSDLSLFEPLHVDVSTPSTNTVILTPSKITIEHSGAGSGGVDASGVGPLNADGPSKHNAAYESSPIHWSYARKHIDVSVSNNNDRTDFIEVISEPEDLCHSHLRNNMYKTKQLNCRENNGIAMQTKQKPYDDGTISIWEHRHNYTDESAPRTIYFRHRSDVVEKSCCDSSNAIVGGQLDDSDTDVELCLSTGCSFNPLSTSTINMHNHNHNNNNNNNSNNNKSINTTNNFSADEDTTTNLKSNKHCCRSLSSLTQLDQLNNAMPLATHTNNIHTGVLSNFRKNNISSFDTHRYLDLSSDLRRYSKITNLEQQNASNLLPNYYTRASTGNLIKLPASNDGAFNRRTNQNLLVSVWTCGFLHMQRACFLP